MSPRYSIVSINKNHALGLRRTLESVANQTCRDFELIVVDGHSVDGSLDVVRAFGELVTRFEVDRGQGIYSAMNQGAELAAGDWTLFLNAGDRFSDPDVLSSVVLPDSGDFLVGQGRYDGRCENIVYRPIEEASKGMFLCHQATFCRTTRVKELRFDTSFQIAGDYEFFCRALKQGLEFSFLYRLVCTVERHGIWESRPYRGLLECRRVSRRHFDARQADVHFLRAALRLCKARLRKRIPTPVWRTLRDLILHPRD